MKTAFISDIHGNLDALEVVLADCKEQDIDRIVCLGDVVGYGPQPSECCQRVREVSLTTVIGNHDYAALGWMDTLGFNEYARVAADWTTKALTDEARGFLEELPLSTALDGMRLVHASPLDPERWTYILSYEEARRQFPAFTERMCFVGHSHLPIVIEEDGEEIKAINFLVDVPLRLHNDHRYIINVGSVGQPRDRDPRTGYAWYDDELDAVMLRRLDYSVETVQEKMRTANLPGFLVARLREGV